MTEMYGDSIEFLDPGDVALTSTTYQGNDVLIVEFEPEVTVLETQAPEYVDLIEVGPGGGGGSASKYTHTQSTPSASWTVVHNLNTIREPVVVLDSAPTEIARTSAEVIDLNSITLTFDSAVTGKAYL